MKKAVVALLLVALTLVLLWPEPDVVVRGQDELANEGADLQARVEHLEELLAFHSHEMELRGILARLDALEATTAREVAAGGSTQRVDVTAAPSMRTEVSRLRGDAQSLGEKLASLERTISPLKAEIANLRLTIQRVESNVARIDLRRP